MLVFVLFVLRVWCACSRRETEYLAAAGACVRVNKQLASVWVGDLLSLCRGETRRERLLNFHCIRYRQNINERLMGTVFQNLKLFRR